MKINILLCILLFIIYTPKTTKNNKRHLTDEYPLGHFSKIDTSNYLLHPQLLTSTSPIRFTLYKGDSIYIPSKWWHWIRSSKSIAVNYWILQEHFIYKKPKLLKTQVNYNNFLNALTKYKGEIHLWDNQTDDIKSDKENSIHNQKDRNYIITLPGYSDKNGIKNRLNESLFNNLKEHINTPSFLSSFKIEKNIWISTGYNDSGLHYDDYDGILTVIEGKKEITLYPPKDTIYLCPFDIKPYWTLSEPLKFEYNLYRHISTLDKTKNNPSSRVLYESMKSVNNKNMLKVITELCNTISINKNIWGFKKKGDELRWEVYFYHFDMYNTNITNNLKHLCFKNVPLFNKFNEELVHLNNTVIHSFDLYNTENVIGDDIHIYYKSDQMKIPFLGYGECISPTKGVIKESIFIIDNYYSFIFNYYSYIKELQLNTTDFLPFLTHFMCKEIAVMNKFDGNIFIMYYGISINNFIKFLNLFHYPTNFIEHVTHNKHLYIHITHEIAIVYNIKTKKPIRSGFYGIV